MYAPYDQGEWSGSKYGSIAAAISSGKVDVYAASMSNGRNVSRNPCSCNVHSILRICCEDSTHMCRSDFTVPDCSQSSRVGSDWPGLD
jgi:hypothetical protein